MRRQPQSAVAAVAVLWLLGCGDPQEIVAPSDAPPVASYDFTWSDPIINGPSHGPTGAIFTTTPDGGIVNENVHYENKLYVYLDGGPRNDNPYAAALDDGWYVFQVTDPSGKYLLSEDPAKCRVMEVEDGVIQRLVLPSEMGLGLTDTYDTPPPGRTTLHCHDPSTPESTDIPGSGQHEVNPDSDPGGGIVVQLMPFGDTPNPGNEYKAWTTTWGAYAAKVPDLAEALEAPPERVRGKASQPCPGFCAAPDPGFGPPRNLQKTDNFKVEEAPPFIRIAKRIDETLDGYSPDDPLYTGGWLMTIGEPMWDGTTITNAYLTGPTGYTQPIAVPSNTTVTVCEEDRDGWEFSYARVGDAAATATTVTVDGMTFQCVEVDVGTGPVTIEVAFGNGMQGTLIWEKHDAAGLRLAGATFEVCRTHDYSLATQTFTAIDPVCFDPDILDNDSRDQDPTDGVFRLTNLRLGRYTVRETIAPDNYLLDPTVHTADVTSSDAVTVGPFIDNLNGRMTGGTGQVILDLADGSRFISAGFTIHCDILLSNNIELNWKDEDGNARRWHITKPIQTAKCTDNPAVRPGQPLALFDTFEGTAEGSLDGVEGSWLEFVFVDGGEPGKREDLTFLRVWSGEIGSSTVVEQIDGDVDIPGYTGLARIRGNIQAHLDQPHGQR